MRYMMMFSTGLQNDLTRSTSHIGQVLENNLTFSALGEKTDDWIFTAMAAISRWRIRRTAFINLAGTPGGW
jgi:hypothetical protein